MSRGATGRLVVALNEMLPILKYLGMWVTIDQIAEHVEWFLHYSRPKGKPSHPRPLSYIFDCQWPTPHCKACGIASIFHGKLVSLRIVFDTVNSVLGKIARRESWKLRRLVSVFNRMAKRGHYPRERGIRRIYQDSGIPLPTDPRFLDVKTFQLQHINTEETPQACYSFQCQCPNFSVPRFFIAVGTWRLGRGWGWRGEQRSQWHLDGSKFIASKCMISRTIHSNI